MTDKAQVYRDRVPYPVGYARIDDLRRARAHRMALIVHDHAWNVMHDYGAEYGRCNAEYRGRHAIMLRAWERVKETTRR
jgi:hypothetical protein